MTDELVKQVLTLFVTIAGVFGVGVGARRVLSKDARDRAKNATEEDWFSTALGEVKLDRDNWRKTAEQAFAERNKIEHQLRNTQMLLRAHRRLVEKECPHLVPYLTSESAPFDDEPETGPMKGKP